MKRTARPNDSYIEEPMNFTTLPTDKTLIFVSTDPALRTFTWSILFAPPMEEEGLGLFFGFKKDLFNGEQTSGKYTAHDCMKRTRAFLLEKEALFSDVHILTIETQMNEFANPNSPAIMQVMGVTYAMGSAWHVPTFVVSPLSTANVFPYIFMKNIPDTFMPNQKDDASRRRHDWNKKCVIDVIDTIISESERLQIEDWNYEMEYTAKANGYRAFKKDLDDYLDPITDNARVYLEAKKAKGIVDNTDLIKRRIVYLSKGYTVKYMAVATHLDSTFTQKWRVDHEKKTWFCVIKVCQSSALAGMLVRYFRFAKYVSEYRENCWEQKMWVFTERDDWETLFGLFCGN